METKHFQLPNGNCFSMEADFPKGYNHPTCKEVTEAAFKKANADIEKANKKSDLNCEVKVRRRKAWLTLVNDVDLAMTLDAARVALNAAEKVASKAATAKDLVAKVKAA